MATVTPPSSPIYPTQIWRSQYEDDTTPAPQGEDVFQRFIKGSLIEILSGLFAPRKTKIRRSFGQKKTENSLTGPEHFFAASTMLREV